MKKIFFLSLLVVFCALQPAGQQAQQLELSSFFLNTRGDRLSAGFSLEMDDFSRVKKSLDEGAKLELIYEVRVIKNVFLFPDFSLASKEVNIGLAKDLISGDYKILFPGRKKVVPEFTRKDFTQLFSNISVPLISLEQLEDNETYLIRIQARLTTTEVPKWIKKTLFFWSWDLVDSLHYEMDFNL
ncbi:MAG: DUF4390 domain-containing protein [Desulfonatronovibrionaceae bacterium]